MRVVVPQITWHSRDPVHSVDFDPSVSGENGFYRLASGGGDSQLLVWRITHVDTFKPELTCVAQLKRHEKPVNVVRFSPDGNFIATGGDDAYIILWKCGEEKTEKQEGWMFEKSLRKHIEDVSDLSWSPDCNFLLSASIDNSAVLWDIKKSVALHVWSEKEHTGFVHGVAYDPLHEFAATMCIDRNLRLFDLKTKKIAHKALKFPEDWVTPEVLEEIDGAEKENVQSTGAKEEETVPKKKTTAIVNRLFQDEFLPTFCRRLCFSPRGELLLVPGGLLPPGSNASDSIKIVEQDVTEKKENASIDKKPKKKTSNNAVIVFCRHSWTNPCAVIPTLDSYAIGTRFCPVYFKKDRRPYVYDENFIAPKKNERSFACVGKIAPAKVEKFPLMKMPYRLVYAIATNDSVLIGDTASSEPLAVIRSIHLARISDITWASNGQALMVSSTDGYCSIITFEKGELGEEFCIEPENFPVLTRETFPILPPEPKKEKPSKRKTPKAKAKGENKTDTDKEQKSAVKKAEKTPTSTKKKPVAKSKLFLISSGLETKDKELLQLKQENGPHQSTNDTANIVTGDEKPKIEIGQSQQNQENAEGTPKFKAQKTTLDRWFTKTLKPVKKEQEKVSATKPKKTVTVSEPEIIILDDEVDAPTTSNATKVYPMTPPIAKPIAARRISTSFSPLSTTSPNVAQKRKQGELTPESLHSLTTAPIKCRRIMEEPELIMESSNRPNLETSNKPSSSELGTQSTQAVTQETQKVALVAASNELITEVKISRKVTDKNCPVSPVSSSSASSRLPRRIQLVTLTPAVTNDEGKLD